LTTSQSDLIAGLVLGSNSFHLLTARREADRLVWEDHHQEAVGLAAGLGDDGYLDPDRIDRARGCLQRFAAVLGEVRPARVGVIATGVFRKALDAPQLVEAASGLLGVPVRVVSDRDEATLSYVGLGLTFGIPEGNRLVIDLGGGTTELVIGRGLNVQHAESLDIGCIGATHRFFTDAGDAAAAFDAAENAFRASLESLCARLQAVGWEETVGTGGTIMGAGTIMQLRRLGGSAITRKGLDRLKNAIVEGRLEELGREVVTGERLAILPGGVALISAMLDVLGIDRMRMAPGALREGLMVMLARSGPGTRASA